MLGTDVLDTQDTYVNTVHSVAMAQYKYYYDKTMYIKLNVFFEVYEGLFRLSGLAICT